MELRKAVRIHVVRQYHNKSRKRIVGTDGNRNQTESARLLADTTNEERRIRMKRESGSRMESPIRVPSEDPNVIECNLVPVDPENSSTRGSASHIKGSHIGLRTSSNAIRFRTTVSISKWVTCGLLLAETPPML
jgi:hypothetical protein